MELHKLWATVCAQTQAVEAQPRPNSDEISTRRL